MGDRFFGTATTYKAIARVGPILALLRSFGNHSISILHGRGVKGSTLYWNNQFKFRFVITRMTRTRMLGAVLVIIHEVQEV